MSASLRKAPPKIKNTHVEDRRGAVAPTLGINDLHYVATELNHIYSRFLFVLLYQRRYSDRVRNDVERAGDRADLQARRGPTLP